ncbi:MoxR family ATPase [Streptomyces sp. S.PNR 29]|uniref:AAA family ATPase n=1 Tax=Streptomyces sp. S.PNR 29 TaxID=2973805 RepID=UPI0025AFA2B3|nr:MoxR family ATPase [Streptomyces sp. S.PNR 29]MDN0196562.1 MoxR family ATPase [Streptomyces sp. S.PNR 29]
MPDRRDGLVYVMPPDLKLAVEVAKATGRPLLLRGNPGSGKSSLAPYVARKANWRYYEYVVTSQTRATDLLWTFDGVRRLADAQMARYTQQEAEKVDENIYVEPGPLWWAFAPTSAADVVDQARTVRGNRRAGGVDGGDPRDERWNQGRDHDHAVVLIDEIDKADPDVPNGLLVPLASNGFTVTETGRRVDVEPPKRPQPRRPFSRHLVIITTNEERELPQAFLRRCVIASAPEPEAVDDLVKIAKAHLRARLRRAVAKDVALAQALAEELLEVRATAMRDGIRPPSTAEYLDALWACRALGIRVGGDDDRWDKLRHLTLVKPQHMKG